MSNYTTAYSPPPYSQVVAASATNHNPHATTTYLLHKSTTTTTTALVKNATTTTNNNKIKHGIEKQHKTSLHSTCESLLRKHHNSSQENLYYMMHLQLQKRIGVFTPTIPYSKPKYSRKSISIAELIN
jgi:hypothetical protein